LHSIDSKAAAFQSLRDKNTAHQPTESANPVMPDAVRHLIAFRIFAFA